MNRDISVAHLTSAHPRYDTRIFFKQCVSLANAGYLVTLIVADGKGSELSHGVSIRDVGRSKGRLERMMKSTRRVFQEARLVDADVYQIHDPELLPVALKLKRAGKIVVFDSHEDVPNQILNKPYLNPFVLSFISKIYRKYQSYVCRRLDAIMAATPVIRDKFNRINANVVDINNYPLLEEFIFDATALSRPKKDYVCYVGGLAAIRGIREIAAAMPLVKSKVRLVLAGTFSDQSFEASVKTDPGWANIDEMGWLDRVKVARLLRDSHAGLVTLLPTPSYLDSLPVKMFEYMGAGIPVIASNFPLWRNIVETENCGLIVDPEDPKSIADAIDYIVQHPELAMELGRNGRKAVEEKYNWGNEERKLLELYERINASA